MSLTIKDISTILQPILIKTTLQTTTPQEEITDFVLDSRQAQQNSCFIALQGENTDGHKYIENALNAGATCYIADKLKITNQIISYPNGFITLNSLEALKLIAKFNAKNITHTIGVTGSAGKTTTKILLDYLLSIAQGKKNVYTAPGNLNGEIGTPLAIANIKHAVKYGILEYASSMPGEILDQLNVLKPDVPILLNVGHAHTQFFGDLDGVFKEKSSILARATKAIIPVSLEQKILQANLLKESYTTFGYSNKADLYINETRLTTAGTTGLIIDNATRQKYSVSIPMYHQHILENIAVAIGTLKYLDIFKPKLLDSLKDFKAPDGRGQIKTYVFNNCKITLADYTYNANEISIRNAIDTINKIPFQKGPKIFYLGDVLELGEKEQEQHKEFGRWLANSKIDYIFLQGPRTAYTYKMLQKLGKDNVFHNEAQNVLIKQLNGILVKHNAAFIWAMGSHGMQTWNITKNWQ